MCTRSSFCHSYLCPNTHERGYSCSLPWKHMSVPLCACLHWGQTDSSNCHNHASRKHYHTQSTKWCKSLSPSFGNSLDSSRRKACRSSNPQSKVFLLCWRWRPFSEVFPVIHSYWNPEKIHKNVKFGLSANVSLFHSRKSFSWWAHTVCLLPTFCSMAVLHGYTVTMEVSSEDSNFPMMVKTVLRELTAKSNFWNVCLLKKLVSWRWYS